MQEMQVTIGPDTFRLEHPFLVMATQNPIESEGTYRLPEAQVDRFMLKVKVGYPTKDEELQIINRMSAAGRSLSPRSPRRTRYSSAGSWWTPSTWTTK